MQNDFSIEDDYFLWSTQIVAINCLEGIAPRTHNLGGVTEWQESSGGWF